jgi:hypothetical protein
LEEGEDAEIWVSFFYRTTVKLDDMARFILGFTDTLVVGDILVDRETSMITLLISRYIDMCECIYRDISVCSYIYIYIYIYICMYIYIDRKNTCLNSTLCELSHMLSFS